MIEEIKKELSKKFQDFFTKDDILSILENVEKNAVLESMGYKIDGCNYVIEHNGKTTELPKKLFLLFRFLVLNKNRIMTRDQILNHVWGNDIIVLERTIDVHIRKLRERFPKNYFVTKKTIGYGWMEKN